jgi:hypothetical protein
MTRLRLLFLAGWLAGCQHAPVERVIERPTFVPLPAGCLADCPYQGPVQLQRNGELLEAWRARGEQVECLQARLQCVRELQPKP